MCKYEDITIKNTILSERIKRFLIILLLSTSLYMPNIAGRGYGGIITLYIVTFIIVLKEKLLTEPVLRSIIVYTFITIILDLILLFKYPSSHAIIIRIFVYALIPMASYMVGLSCGKNVKKVFIENILIFMGIMQGLIGILQRHSYFIRNLTLKNYANFEKYNYNFESWAVGRSVGTIGNPNTYGIFMVFFVIFLFSIVLRRDKSKSNQKLAACIGLAISIYAIALTQSRTAYLLLTLGFFLSIFMSGKRVFRKLISLTFVSTIGYLIIQKIPFLSRRFSIQDIATMNSRTGIWKMFFNTYMLPLDVNLFIGYGANFVRNIGKAVDNYYLQIVLEYGLIGLFLYSIIIVSILFSFLNKKASLERNFIIIGFIVILISDITGTVNMHPDFSIILFFLFGYYSRVLQ